MREKFLALMLVLWASFATNATAATTPTGNAAAGNEASVVSSGDGDSLNDLPRIARNQRRPLASALCDECGIENIDPDPGYIEGGCNCSRICYDNHFGCSLSVHNNACQAGTTTFCRPCSVNCP